MKVLFLRSGKFNNNSSSQLGMIDFHPQSLTFSQPIFMHNFELERDVQSFDYDNRYFYVISHHPNHIDSSLMVFEADEFMSNADAVAVYEFSGLPRPTCVRCFDGKIYVTCVGIFEGQYTKAGLYILKIHEKKLVLKQIIHENFENTGPSGVSFYKDSYLVSLHQASKIKNLSDQSKDIELSGGYPISVDSNDKYMVVTDFIYNKIAIHEYNNKTRFIGGQLTQLSLPWGVRLFDNFIVVANTGELKTGVLERESSILIFDQKILGNTAPIAEFKCSDINGICDLKIVGEK